MNIRISITILVIAALAGCRSLNPDGPKSGSSLPSLTMRLIDSTTEFNTEQIKEGKPFVIIYFSPDCQHCRKETRDLVANIGLVRNIQFILLTPMSYDDLRYFYKEFNLAMYSNLTVGQDDRMTFYHYFNPKAIPYTAIYNRNKQLNKVIIGEASIQKIIEFINS